MLKLSRRGTLAGLSGAALAGPAWGQSRVGQGAEQWGTVEIALEGPRDWAASPEPPLTVFFSKGRNPLREVAGFWDGRGVYRVRFMPDQAGEWGWLAKSAIPALDGRSGVLTVAPPSRTNHGPVRVAETFHFAYADGTPFRQLGTTAYAWAHQSERRCEQTLRTLGASPFNKIRMAVFPNASVTHEPIYPFARAGDAWDFTRINPVFFQRFDRRVAALRDIGVEADVILFHPYDNERGFSAMSREQDEIYLRYLAARLSAYRNVWWSLANEWDILKKSDDDWDHLFGVIQNADPYDHLRSIHNWRRLYDHNKPWITHASIQAGAAVEDDARALLFRDVYRKPVIFDEVRYEGDLSQRWGDLTPQHMVRAFWEGFVAGTYVGHGEAYEAPEGFWLGIGGALRGQSPLRLQFLRDVMETGPAPGIDPLDRWWGRHIGGKAGAYYLRYFGEDAPREWQVDLPKDELAEGARFRADVIDTWGMTITPIEGEFTLSQTGPYSFADPARPTIALPGRQWMAVRMVRA